MSWLGNFKASFLVFLDENSGDNNQYKQLKDDLNTGKIDKVFSMSIALVIWSSFAIILDMVFASAGVVASVSGNGLSSFLPAAIFFLIGVIARLSIVAHYGKGLNISNRVRLLLLIPGLGFGLFIGRVLYDQLIFRTALLGFLKELKKEKQILKTLRGKIEKKQIA